MKKHVKLLVVNVAILGILTFLPSCFNPMGFDVQHNVHITGEIGVTGDIYSTDVTSAVLLMVNRSKSINVKDVKISQPEWEPDTRNSLPYETSFTNKPKSLEKKAVYLNPSQHNYCIEIQYEYWDAPGQIQNGNKTVNVPLPLPRQIVEVHIYRDIDGDVVISVGKEESPPHPDDTGIPAEDPLIGQGSVPAVIPPDNRTRMATFIIVNRTNSQVIENVAFRMSGSEYTIGKVNVNDRQSIALGQGAWEGHVSYIVNNNMASITPRNFVVVPSNDPQSIREHYMYFYRNRLGGYSISTDWPPVPNDVHEEDILPPDEGFGRGVIEITNNTNALVTSVNIRNVTTDIDSKFIGFEDFFPPTPIQRRVGYISVVGTSDFPIKQNEFHLIQVDVMTENFLFTFEERAHLFNNIVRISIDQNDINLENVFNSNNRVGAVIHIQNNASNTSQYENATITQMVVRNRNTFEDVLFTQSTWEPSVEITANANASQRVISSPEMPILPGDTFEYTLTVRFDQLGSNPGRRYGQVTRTFPGNGGVLYSSAAPANNIHHAVLNGSDVEQIMQALPPPPTPTTPTIQRIQTITFVIRLTDRDGAVNRMMLVRDPTFNAETHGIMQDLTAGSPARSINQTGRTTVNFMQHGTGSSQVSLNPSSANFRNNTNFGTSGSNVLVNSSLNSLVGRNDTRRITYAILDTTHPNYHNPGPNQLRRSDIINGFMLYFVNHVPGVRAHSSPPRVATPRVSENLKFWVHPPTHVGGPQMVTEDTSLIIHIDHDEYRTQTSIRSVELVR